MVWKALLAGVAVATGIGGAAAAQEVAVITPYLAQPGTQFYVEGFQAAAKDKGRPWDTAKGFDDSAPMTAITPAGLAGGVDAAHISLKVNGELRQQGQVSDLIWSIPELIAELSIYYRLKPGDLIFTGTPSGVAAVQPGDVLEGQVDHLETLRITMGPRI